MTPHEKQLADTFHCKNIQWASAQLAKPESELPGTLTHEKAYRVYEESSDAVLDLRLSGRYKTGADGHLHFAGYEE